MKETQKRKTKGFKKKHVYMYRYLWLGANNRYGRFTKKVVPTFLSLIDATEQ